MNDIAQILRSKGLKVTPQRIAIYNMLMNSKEHPNAEMIYKALEPSNPTMSLATVYKTLDFFKSTGLIQELNVCAGCSRYDAVAYSHPHVVCTQCGNVYDLPVEGLTNIRERITHLTEFQLESEQIIFYGICPKCIDETNE
ncbi:MAG: transcriptional repressor [Epulopiscium sp.]|jgi:Fur family peroxide stress response transcriptional regulator|nr:transcriptional repressor [Candidatus Epulonipiscium sp.]